MTSPDRSILPDPKRPETPLRYVVLGFLIPLLLILGTEMTGAANRVDTWTSGCVQAHEAPALRAKLKPNAAS